MSKKRDLTKTPLTRREDQMLTALYAIRARLNGEWNNPALERMGVLRSNSIEDILAWTEEAIDNVEHSLGVEAILKKSGYTEKKS